LLLLKEAVDRNQYVFSIFWFNIARLNDKLGRLQTNSNEYSFFEFQDTYSNFRIRGNLTLFTIRISNNFEFEYEYLRIRIFVKGFQNHNFLKE
jgi:hypothetical protein